MKLLSSLLRRSLTRRMLLVQLFSIGSMLVALFIALWQLAPGLAKAETEQAVEQLGHILIDLADPARRAPLLVAKLLTASDKDAARSIQFDNQVRFEIRDAQGALLSASTASPHAVSDGWLTREVRDFDTGRTALVAANEIIARDLWREDSVYLMTRVALATLAMIVPVILLATFLLTSFTLSPISELRQKIAARTANNLTPVDTTKRYPELAPLVDELNRLLEKLREAQAVERRFFADAAHELLTPVAALRAQIHLLATAPDVQAQQRAHADVDVGLQRLTALIRQLLTIARVSSSEVQLDMRPHDLVPLVQNRLGVAALRALDRNIGISLEAPRDCWFVFDRDTVATLLDNLIDNAIRYLPAAARAQSGQIKIKLRLYPHAVWIVVADNGPGIPIEYRSKVIERFFRMPGNNETGSGLGLAIVAQIVTLHRGILLLQDGIDGCGLAACVRLPSQPASNP